VQTDRRTDGQTDGGAMAYSALQHICCRALKMGKHFYIFDEVKAKASKKTKVCNK